MDIQPNEILQFFAYEHLPPHLQEVSKPFGRWRSAAIPGNAERDMVLHKLLESKIAARSLAHFLRGRSPLVEQSSGR